jgi:hypothetical protein
MPSRTITSWTACSPSWISSSPKDAQYGEKMRTLQQSVERHITSEEDALFAQARIHLTDERLERLGRDMAVLRESLGGEPSRSGRTRRASAVRA